MNEKTMNMKEDIRRISGKIIKISQRCVRSCVLLVQSDHSLDLYHAQ